MRKRLKVAFIGLWLVAFVGAWAAVVYREIDGPRVRVLADEKREIIRSYGALGRSYNDLQERNENLKSRIVLLSEFKEYQHRELEILEAKVLKFEAFRDYICLNPTFNLRSRLRACERFEP